MAFRQSQRARRATSARSVINHRSFELLWGGRERPSRGPKPGLSLDTTVKIAIDLVDAEGLAALTMNRLAGQLGVTTMALYRYVPGKEELIDLMIDTALGTPSFARSQDWRTELGEWARSSLAILHRHPWLLGSIAHRVPIGPNWLTWVESALQAVSNINLNGREMMAVVVLVDGHVRASAQNALGVTGTKEWAARFSRALQTVRSEERYPGLRRVLAADGFDEPAEDLQNQFEFGLQRLLDGIEAFVSVRDRLPAQRRSTRGRSRKVR